MSDLDQFRAEIAQRRLNRQIEARQLSRLIKQRQAETWAGVPILAFYAYNYQGIAIVQIFGDRARISRFTDIGPMGHSEATIDNLASELHEEGFRPIEDPNAAAMLELWASRPKWAEGLISMQLVNIINTLSYHGYNAHSREVQYSRDLALGYHYCKQFQLTIY